MWYRRSVDWGLLIALAMALLAASPFLSRPGLPRDTDAELHVFRAAELAACWQAGVLYPRWAPDFYYGYGYPIFNYYAPLTYHLASLFALLPGMTIVSGVKGVFILGLILGGIGTYLLGRDLLGAEGGIVAAAAFLYAPYVLFIDPHARGDLAEHFAIGLLPLALFFLRRWVERGGRLALMGTAICTAALLVSHNLLGVIGFALILASFVWQVAVEGCRDGVGRGGLALTTALALSSFFWVPLLAELGEVHLSVIGHGHFDFRSHFVALTELLAPSRIMDLGAVAPRYRMNVGLAQWLLAGAGSALLIHRRIRRQRAFLFFGLVSVTLVFLMTSASCFVWEAIPPLAYLQFPWRLLGPAALTLAVCAGAAEGWLAPTRRRSAALAGIVLIILLTALPTMFPPTWEPEFGDTSPTGIVRFELQGKVLGTTSTGDYLPRTVETFLHPEPALVASYDQPGPLDKVNRATLPEGTVVQVVEHGPTHDRFLVSGEHNFVFRLYTLLFPGWHAYVDGEEVSIEPGRPEGFITFWVPKGEHEVWVRFEDTPPRRTGWWLTGGGIVGLILTAVRATRRVTPPTGHSISRGTAAWVVGAVAGFLAFKILLVNPHPAWFRYTSPPGEAWAARHPQRAVLGGEVELLGFDLPRQRVRSGETIPLILYWQALRPLTVNYQSFVHLTYPSSISWGQSDALNPGGLPTTRWPLDRYVWDTHRVQVRPGTPPGIYTLEVGLYTLADGHRLTVQGPDGQVVGETVVLEIPVEVLPARRQPSLEDLGMDEQLGATYGGQITLLGYSTPSRRTEVPGFLHLALFWRAERSHPEDLVVTVAIVDGVGEVVAQASGAPAGGRYPTSRWTRGEIVRDAYAFWLGEDFSLGTYTVGVAVHRGDQPVWPEGREGPFLEIFTAEAQGWEQ